MNAEEGWEQPLSLTHDIPKYIHFLPFRNGEKCKSYFLSKKDGLAIGYVARSVTIHPHDNNLLYPVAAYKLYTAKFATALCLVDILSLARVQVNALFRSQEIFGQAIGTQHISKYIKQLMVRVGRQKGAPIPKARALGSTIAAASGISIDDIMAYGSSNTTKAALDQQLRSQSSKCNLILFI
ncbi:hypothetical protein BJ944DRAFT_239328 [Cunninghamella echinulata]|nr:hypothetical protein BJ944DRAFT_239328 [Cunninghamella echinulata]